jgi:hypothetical protein
MLVFSLSMTTPLGADERFKKERDQAVHIMVRNKNNVPSPAAITAIRTSSRDKFLPAEAAAAITTVPGFGMDADLIDKFHRGKVAEMNDQVEWNLQEGIGGLIE